MITTLTPDNLVSYTNTQLAHLFPDGRTFELGRVAERALDRLAFTISKIKLPGFSVAGTPRFNHLHSDQYAMYVYLLSNEAWKDGQIELAEKLFGLNKALNGLICMYDTVLPSVFALVHTVGMMLGKATYSDYFFASHHCTIGTNRNAAPVLGQGLVLFGGASVIGKCQLGEDVSVSADTQILDQDVPSSSIAIGRSPNLTIKASKRVLANEVFVR